MYICRFRCQRDEFADSRSRLDSLAEAAEEVREIGNYEHLTPCILYPRVLGRAGPNRLTDVDAGRVGWILAENRRAIELIDLTVARSGGAVAPPKGARRPGEPGAWKPCDGLGKVPDLYKICYLDARFLIYHRRWKECLSAVGRIFRVSDILCGAGRDWTIGTDAWFAKCHAYQAILELALQPDASHRAVLGALRLVENAVRSPRAFLESRWGSFWRNILSLFDRLGDRTDAAILINSLLVDRAARDGLTVPGPEYFADIEIENPETWAVKLVYPATEEHGEADFRGYWFLSATRWLSGRREVAFDRSETLAILNREAERILAHIADPPHVFPQLLETSDNSAGCRAGRYCLTEMLDHAATGSEWSFAELLTGVGAAETEGPGGHLPANAVGRALAADVISAPTV